MVISSPGVDIGGRDQIERRPGKVAADPCAGAARMVAQADEAQRQRAAPDAVGIAVPVKIIIVEDGTVERGALLSRHDDHRSRLDDRAGRDRLSGENAAPALGSGADFEGIVRDRQNGRDPVRPTARWPRVSGLSAGFRRARAGARRGRAPAAAVLIAATGGVTWAGVAPTSGSSSSRMPALNALMPLAKSPMTRGSLPAPNRIRMMARTTIQCIRLKEPISTTPKADEGSF